MAAADGLQLYLDALGPNKRLSDDEDIRILCEYHEDWVAMRGGAAELVSAKAALESHKSTILDDIEKEFIGTIKGLKIASVETSGFDRDNYLPLINGKAFTKAMMSGGGSMTAMQIAYWTSLMTVAERTGVPYPSILIIDGPRLALDPGSVTCKAIYQRLVRGVSESPGAVQFIVADNEIPNDYHGDFSRVGFDYGHPTVSTVRHPGQGNVDVIASADE